MTSRQPPTEQAAGLLDHLLRLGIEATVVILVVLSPWAFGAVHQFWQWLIACLLALLLLLWAGRMLLTWRVRWHPCPVFACLVGLLVLAGGHLVPLPEAIRSFLSPSAEQLKQRFMPEQPEVFPPGSEQSSASWPAGPYLGVYPGGSRAVLPRLLAVVVLFAVVRNNLAEAAVLRRLAVVLVCNGVALSLFALIQFLNAAPQTVYWVYPVLGAPYGPFICRNHFAFYVNVCIGLGLGLLLGMRPFRTQRESAKATWADRLGLSGLLQEPAALWLCVGLSVMAAGVVCSLSRGGVLALLGALALGLLVRLISGRGAGRLAGIGVIGLVASALIAWFGFDMVEKRLATVWQGHALHEGRLRLWQRVLPLAWDFWLCGSGPGTFSLLEPMLRQPGEEEAALDYEYAHNDYLEALIEGGVPRLLLTVLAAGLIGWFGWRAARRRDSGADSSLALGTLVGIMAVVLHSVGDFGLHLPAVALLTTVVAAHLAGMGRRRSERPLELSGAWPLLGAVTALVMAGVLVGEGWRAERAERYRLAALGSRPDASPVQRQRQLAYLNAATRLTPENADLLQDLGEAYWACYLEGMNRREAAVRAQAVGLAAQACGLFSATLAWNDRLTQTEADLARQALLPAIQAHRTARDLCPLHPLPHLRLAGAARRLPVADSPRAYLARAQSLRPNDPEVWYVSGVQALAEGQADEAWPAWRRCLECSSKYLAEILQQAQRVLSSAEIADKVFPNRPEQLAAAAEQLDRRYRDEERSRPFREKAVRLLEERKEALSAADWQFKAKLHQALSQPEAAIEAYEQALDRQPLQAPWRLQLAHLLFQQGRLAEARRQLTTLLGLHPDHAEALRLHAEVIRAGGEDAAEKPR